LIALCAGQWLAAPARGTLFLFIVERTEEMNGVIAAWMLAAVMGAAPQDEIWMTDYAQALEAARTDAKPLLVVMHKPNEPKEAIRQVSFTKSSEQLAVLKNYHLCQIDVTTPAGKKVAQAFKVTSFPYTVITDKTAKQIIFRKAGAFSDGQWTTTLSDYRRGVKPISAIATSYSPYSFGAPGSCPNCR
jgi:hypothetical protein